MVESSPCQLGQAVSIVCGPSREARTWQPRSASKLFKIVCKLTPGVNHFWLTGVLLSPALYPQAVPWCPASHSWASFPGTLGRGTYSLIWNEQSSAVYSCPSPPPPRTATTTTTAPPSGFRQHTRGGAPLHKKVEGPFWGLSCPILPQTPL